MTFIVPPITAIPTAQPSSAAQGLSQQNQVVNATQAAVAASAVRTETRSAAGAAGNSGESDRAKRDKGRNADNGADATEAQTDRVGPRPRGMGRNADLSV